MALLAPQQIGYAGTLPTLSAATTSDTVAPDDRVFLWYKNTDASTEPISIVTPTTLNKFGQDLPNIVVTIAATTGEEMIGPMVADLADPTTGLITITMASAAGVTVAAVRV
jgi:hypothetical protein